MEQLLHQVFILFVQTFFFLSLGLDFPALS